MTAEIGILNREGIALAADSAVTCTTSGRTKILNSANKLFNLIKGLPIGIMIYGKGSFMGLSWEIVINEYRNYVKSENLKFDTLEEWSDNFINFLNNDDKLYKNSDYVDLIYNYLFDIIQIITNEASEEIYSEFTDRTPTAKESDDIFIKHLNKIIDDIEQIEFAKGFGDEDVEIVKNKSKDIVKMITSQLVVNINQENIEKIERLAGLLLCKDLWMEISGIVIAGYGDTDLLPKLTEYHVEGIINNKLKYKLNKESKIYQNEGTDCPIAEIVPFAQQEMIHSILTGIDPQLYTFLFDKIGKSYQQILIYVMNLFNIKKEDNNLENMNIEFLNDQSAITSELEDIKSNKFMLLDESMEKISRFAEFLQNNLKNIKDELKCIQFENFISPILGMVSLLKKEELAVMAETLVNITSFKRKFTLDDETVGGPIDVAVISKCDGFIWIKRKHYFDKDLNHTYFNKDFV